MKIHDFSFYKFQIQQFAGESEPSGLLHELPLLDFLLPALVHHIVYVVFVHFLFHFQYHLAGFVCPLKLRVDIVRHLPKSLWRAPDEI